MGRRLRPVLAACGLVSLCGCSGIAGGQSDADRDLGQAALLTASCSGCHAEGGSPRGITALDGMTAGALEAKLLAYRNDPEGGSAMHRMARGYTEQQLALVARTLGQ